MDMQSRTTSLHMDIDSSGVSEWQKVVVRHVVTVSPARGEGEVESYSGRPISVTLELFLMDGMSSPGWDITIPITFERGIFVGTQTHHMDQAVSELL